MLANDYATAVYLNLQNGMSFDTAVKNLDAVLLRHGHTKLRVSILRKLVRAFEIESEKNDAVLTVANSEAEKKLHKNIKEVSLLLGLSEELSSIVDPHVIGGFKLEYQGKRIDRTYKKALFTLFKKITS